MRIPTKANIERYLHQFDPAGLRGGRIERNLTPTGANNHFNWLVNKGGKKYVVRIAKPKGNLPTDITIEYLALSHLEGTGLAPRPHWIDPAGFLYPLLIEDFVEGKTPSIKPDISDLKAIARTVAKLHQCQMPKNIPLADRGYGPRFKTLEKRLEKALESPLVREAANESGFVSLVPRIRKFFGLASSVADSCPRVFLHGDLYLGNVLIAKKSKRAVLIDFQSPAIGDPTFDFGNIFVDVSWRRHYGRFKDVFLSEYLRYHDYPKLSALFDLRMVERDTTSIISEFRDAAAKLPQTKAAMKKYFDYKRPHWRVRLIEQALGRLGI